MVKNLKKHKIAVDDADGTHYIAKTTEAEQARIWAEFVAERQSEKKATRKSSKRSTKTNKEAVDATPNVSGLGHNGFRKEERHIVKKKKRRQVPG
jgi:hypothetical protein